MELFLSAMMCLFCAGRSGEYSGQELALLTFSQNKKSLVRELQNPSMFSLIAISYTW